MIRDNGSTYLIGSKEKKNFMIEKIKFSWFIRVHGLKIFLFLKVQYNLNFSFSIKLVFYNFDNLDNQIFYIN